MGCAAWLAVTSHGHWCRGAFSRSFWRGFKDSCAREGNPAEPRQHLAAHTPLKPHPVQQCCVTLRCISVLVFTEWVSPLLCPCFPSLSTWAGGTKLLLEGRTHLGVLLAPCTDRNYFLPPWRVFKLCFYLKLCVSTKHKALEGPLASAAISSTMLW